MIICNVKKLSLYLVDKMTIAVTHVGVCRHNKVL